MNNTVTPRAWVGVPLLADDSEPIGVISVQDDQIERFDDQTINLLSQVASHLSLGVQKIHLFEERERQVAENAQLFTQAQAHASAIEQQAQRLRLVHRLSLALSGRFDTQEILDLAVKELGPLFDSDHTGIVLFNEETATSAVVAESPLSGALGMQLPIEGNPITEWLLATRQPLVIESIEHDPMAVSIREFLLPLGVASIMIVPLVSRDRVIGSIGIDSMGQPRRFSTQDQELFMTVAASVAAAFENARLFAAEHAARSTADTLREVARVLSSTFDSNEVLDLILDQLRRVIVYDSASIMLAEGDLLQAVAQRGLDVNAMPQRQTFALRGLSGASMAVAQREPVVINDTAASPDWQVHSVGKHIRSWLGVPLLSKGHVLGVLNIDSHQPNHFSERDVEVALAFANQAAVALENAQLYQQSVTRVEQELEIARRIQSNLFPRELPRVPGITVAARAQPARETGGDFYDVVPLGERQLGLIIGDASGKSIPAAMLMSVARSIARSEAHDHELPDTVVRETNRWIVRDVPARSFVALSYGRFDAASRRLVLANAGQLAPLRRSADGSVSYLDVPGPTLPLGIVPETQYEAAEFVLAAGDTLVFYTDGIVEAHNAQRELFGFERLERIVSEFGHQAPDELIMTLLNAVETFCDGYAQHDDMTLLVLHLEGDQAA
ncbi:MAG TPA: SpoIIE family protein phosphatase, partial [Roseiflexaceae bacterium]|nr:SpoIIE family protein phosphatase [Roseiflexaceae bacterium]